MTVLAIEAITGLVAMTLCATARDLGDTRIRTLGLVLLFFAGLALFMVALSTPMP